MDEIRQLVQRLADMPLIAARATQAHDSGVGMRTKPPDMQIGHSRARIFYDDLDRGGMLRLCGVEQYTGRILH